MIAHNSERVAARALFSCQCRMVLSPRGKARRSRMARKDGRKATEPYRVRVGNVWYWVDPTVPTEAIEPGDTVVIYPVDGDATLAILQSRFKPGDAAAVEFSTLQGERFTVP